MDPATVETLTFDDVRYILAGRSRIARIEDPRNERIVVMGSFLHVEGRGVFRLDHLDEDNDELIHCVWPD